MADLFLSYAREDIKKAEMLATALENQGWSLFWDRTSLLAGQDFEVIIEHAIQQAGCMIVAWSAASKQSNWVRGEASIGRERNILIPILFEPVEPPIAFRSLHTENFTNWIGDPDAQAYINLCKAINECLTSKTIPSVNSAPSDTALKKEKNSNTNFLTRFFKYLWDWLSVTKHQHTLAFIGGGLAVVIAGSWQAYLHFSKKSTEINPSIVVSGNSTTKTGTMTATANNGGSATNIVGNNNVVGDTNASANIKAIVDKLTNTFQLDTQAKGEQIKDLTELVTDLSRGQGILGTETQIKMALETLSNGDTTQAKSLFINVIQKTNLKTKQREKAYQNLDALELLDNSKGSIRTNSKATELDVVHTQGSNSLESISHQVGYAHQASGINLSFKPNIPAAMNRVALVIGNSHYSTGLLKYSENDAKVVAKTLIGLGFEVDYYTNLSLQDLKKHIFDFFRQKAAKSILRLIYYAGHGVQFKDHNYLIPVDAKLATSGETPQTSFLLDELHQNLDALPQGASIIILDMCRVTLCTVDKCRGDLISSLGMMEEQHINGKRSVGFTNKRNPNGTLIAYVTDSCKSASDREDAEHSLYTQILVELMSTPGLPVEKLFRQLTVQVYQRSGGKQKPEFVNGLMGDEICLKMGSQGQCPL